VISVFLIHSGAFFVKEQRVSVGPSLCPSQPNFGQLYVAAFILCDATKKKVRTHHQHNIIDINATQNLEELCYSSVEWSTI
jgi:hypothetical protein